jgi:hypothetical protein
VGGDGFQPRVDPTDANIVYGQYQHGELFRYDRKSGERVEIQPQPEPGEPGSHWNWDSPAFHQSVLAHAALLRVAAALSQPTIVAIRGSR